MKRALDHSIDVDMIVRQTMIQILTKYNDDFKLEINNQAEPEVKPNKVLWYEFVDDDIEAADEFAIVKLPMFRIRGLLINDVKFKVIQRGPNNDGCRNCFALRFTNRRKNDIQPVTIVGFWSTDANLINKKVRLDAEDSNGESQ